MLNKIVIPSSLILGNKFIPDNRILQFHCPKVVDYLLYTLKDRPERCGT